MSDYATPWDLFDLNNPIDLGNGLAHICRVCGSLVPDAPPNAPFEVDWPLRHTLWHRDLPRID